MSMQPSSSFSPEAAGEEAMGSTKFLERAEGVVRMTTMTSIERVGFVGIGKIGFAMAKNMALSGLLSDSSDGSDSTTVPSSSNCARAGVRMTHYDASEEASRRFAAETGSRIASSVEEVGRSCDVVFTVLPNDEVLRAVAFGAGGNGAHSDVGEIDDKGLIAAMKPNAVHVSCSTIGPWTARTLADAHKERGSVYVSAPVFSRPDGMAARKAVIPISGGAAYVGEDSTVTGRGEEGVSSLAETNRDQTLEGSTVRGGAETESAPKSKATHDTDGDWAISKIRPLLESTSTTIDASFGPDPGAATVVKLCGNFLIASAIESMSEAYALAEANGVDRAALHELLGGTIFDCLIYRGYGQRVSARDHAPYPDAHFPLALGRKDVDLVKETARRSTVAMPVASLLGDRFSAGVARGRGELDWSAIGLGASEDAGVDVEEAESWCQRDDPKLDWTPPT